jgi:hypothetical protein
MGIDISPASAQPSVRLVRIKQTLLTNLRITCG